ncbi:hypothetical protein F4809DRAFT_630820, partial [Biscogniauxia mediterranea]
MMLFFSHFVLPCLALPCLAPTLPLVTPGWRLSVIGGENQDIGEEKEVKIKKKTTTRRSRRRKKFTREVVIMLFLNLGLDILVSALLFILVRFTLHSSIPLFSFHHFAFIYVCIQSSHIHLRKHMFM